MDAEAASILRRNFINSVFTTNEAYLCTMQASASWHTCNPVLMKDKLCLHANLNALYTTFISLTSHKWREFINFDVFSKSKSLVCACLWTQQGVCIQEGPSVWKYLGGKQCWNLMRDQNSEWTHSHHCSEKKKCFRVCNILQAIKVWCDVLRCTAVFCNVSRPGGGMSHNSWIISVCLLICLIYAGPYFLL